MNSMQKRIETAIESVVKDAGMKASVNYDYANTGSIYITDADTFAVRVKVEFSFQAGYATVDMKQQALPNTQWHDDKPLHFYLDYSNGKTIDRFLESLALALEDWDGDVPQSKLMSREVKE